MTSESLTYHELAERLGVKPDSARKAARRHRWKRSLGNDGLARVLVPLDDLPPSRPSPDPVPPGARVDSPPDDLADASLLSRELELRLEGLRALLAAEGRRADAAEADRDRWHALAIRPWWKRLAG